MMVYGIILTKYYEYKTYLLEEERINDYLSFREEEDIVNFIVRKRRKYYKKVKTWKQT